VLLYSPGVINRSEPCWHPGYVYVGSMPCGQLTHQSKAGDNRMEKLLLTVWEAADVLSVSRSRVYELLYAEQLDLADGRVTMNAAAAAEAPTGGRARAGSSTSMKSWLWPKRAEALIRS
jgi:hypothetical protein